MWKSPFLYHQNGAIKKQGRRREGRGNGVVMNVVPQLPSFRVLSFIRGGREKRGREEKDSEREREGKYTYSCSLCIFILKNIQQ